MNIKKILLLIIVGIIVLTGTILYFYSLSFGKFSRTFIYDKTSINEIYIDDKNIFTIDYNNNKINHLGRPEKFTTYSFNEENNLKAFIYNKEIKKELQNYYFFAQLNNNKLIFNKFNKDKDDYIEFAIYDISSNTIEKTFKTSLKYNIQKTFLTPLLLNNGDFLLITNSKGFLIEKYSYEKNKLEKTQIKKSNGNQKLETLSMSIPIPLENNHFLFLSNSMFDKNTAYMYDSNNNTLEEIKKEYFANGHSNLWEKTLFIKFIPTQANRFISLQYSPTEKTYEIKSFIIKNNQIYLKNSVIKKDVKYNINSADILPLNNQEIIIIGGIKGTQGLLTYPAKETYLLNLNTLKLTRIINCPGFSDVSTVAKIKDNKILIIDEKYQKYYIFERSKLWQTLSLYQ